jgi:hypothetical protein
MDDALREIVEGLRADKVKLAWATATGAADDLALSHQSAAAVRAPCTRSRSGGAMIPGSARNES